MNRYLTLFVVLTCVWQPLVPPTIGSDTGLSNVPKVSENENPLRGSNDRDPTAPSPQILLRLKGNTPNAIPAVAKETKQVEPEQPIIPVFRLKAMVLQDADHGRAIISVHNRNVILQLSRSQYFVGLGNSPTPSAGFSVDGIHFSLRDFTDRSVTLKSSTDDTIIIVR
jgi:hypothetical protein